MNTHKAYERDSRLAKMVREEATGVCKICDTDYSKQHGDLGKSVIEAHHLMQLSKGVRKTLKDDLIAICANCHRLTHAWMSKKNVARLSQKSCVRNSEMTEVVQSAILRIFHNALFEMLMAK
jgi:predicted HNH restriction endonuclease